MRMERTKLDNGVRFRSRNLTFDRASIDKRRSSEGRAMLAWALQSRDRGRPKVNLVCHDGLRQTWNDGGNTISSIDLFLPYHSQTKKLFYVVLVVFDKNITQKNSVALRGDSQIPRFLRVNISWRS